MTIKDKIETRSKRNVFFRKDFNDIAGYDQIGRVLNLLIQEGVLLRVGQGVYTKARRNQITGKTMPAAPGGSASVIIETLDRLKIPYLLGDATKAYNEGSSTQIPAYVEIKTPRRFSRKLIIGNSKINEKTN
ncbi:S-adenosylhomocysteine hydrolase [Proteus mirabilis]|nr:S-adenosylhomocysteine hydrolase [Proteus mirabilis]